MFEGIRFVLKILTFLVVVYFFTIGIVFWMSTKLIIGTSKILISSGEFI